MKKLKTGSTPAKNVTTKEFDNPINKPKFTVFNISGNRRCEEVVKVTYKDDNGNEYEFDLMTYDELKVINAGQSRRDRNDWKVEIDDTGIKSITV